MEIVDADIPRGHAVPLARLRPGLELGPALPAVARLATGELISIDPDGRVAHHGDRPAREVVAEFLADTGLSHTDLTWTAEAEEEPTARSVAEATLFLTGDPDEAVETHGDRVRHGERSVLVAPGPSLLDASQWQSLADRSAGQAADLIRDLQAHRPTRAEYSRAEDLLIRAIDYAGEVLALVPDGEPAVPVRHLWTAAGLQAWRTSPERFRVPRLDRDLARHRRALAEFAAVFGPPQAERTVAMTPPLARSGFDASMYLDFQECRCGGRLISVAERTAPGDEWAVLTVKARCNRRTWHRYRYRFTVAAGAPETPHWEMSGRREPSHVVDPGEWLVAAEGFAGGDPQMHAMNMKLAASSVEEAMLFVPPGAEAIPESEVRGRRGKALYSAAPERFRWAQLLAARDAYLAASGAEDPGGSLPARTVDEAVLFMERRRCVCGETELHRRERELAGDAVRREVRFFGVCLMCRRKREFVFTVPRDAPAGPGFSRPGDGPSALLDAGEFWAAGEEDGTPEALARSVAVCDELLALIPDDGTEVPEQEFRTPTGRMLRRRQPEVFTRSHLTAERERRQRRLDEFLTTVPPPDGSRV
ncbi:hypothetical protein AB0F81_22695 [Actinoplanes sp. NPDC024001]|uniref:hypothetical protein n=1 Tax=Actinoplanes sp. NPDC024001 TaxID=3154598 RepID=UPI0033E0AB45